MDNDERLRQVEEWIWGKIVVVGGWGRDASVREREQWVHESISTLQVRGGECVTLHSKERSGAPASTVWTELKTAEAASYYLMRYNEKNRASK